MTVDHLLTLDGHEIERCLVRVTVQLIDRDKYSSLAGLAAEYGTELEGHLLQRVKNEVAMEMHAAVKMNRLADLRRQTVQQVMAERWLPKTFASGALVRRDFAVIEVSWPKDSAIPAAIAQQSSAKKDQTASAVQAGTCCGSPSANPGGVRGRIDHGRWTAPDLAPLRRTGTSSDCRCQGRKVGNCSCRSQSGARRVMKAAGSAKHLAVTSTIAICILWPPSQIPSRIWFAPGSSRSTAVPVDWYRFDRSMMTRSCGSASTMRCNRPRSVREDCRLVANRIERRYGGWFPMSGSSSWRRTRRADPMSVSGTPS